MASENKSTVFIFKWRVFDFCLVVSKEKDSVQGDPDNSRLESARVSWWLEPARAESRCELDSSSRVRGFLELAREQHYKHP